MHIQKCKQENCNPVTWKAPQAKQTLTDRKQKMTKIKTQNYTYKIITFVKAVRPIEITEMKR